MNKIKIHPGVHTILLLPSQLAGKPVKQNEGRYRRTEYMLWDGKSDHYVQNKHCIKRGQKTKQSDECISIAKIRSFCEFI